MEGSRKRREGGPRRRKGERGITGQTKDKGGGVRRGEEREEESPRVKERVKEKENNIMEGGVESRRIRL